MENDTVSLLKECNSGCKMATNSMEQVMPFVKDEKLKQSIEECNRQHVEIGEKCHSLLKEAGAKEEDPPAMASAFSWFTTEMKLMLKDDSHQIATLLVDGSNMGIKSLSGYLNQYKAADKDSVELVEKLIDLEQKFATELLEYV